MMAKVLIKGVTPALVTPYNDDCTINFEDLKNLVEDQVNAGVGNICCVAHAGDVMKLTKEERKQVIEAVVTTARKRVPIIAGVESEYDMEALELAKDAKKAGADAFMVLPPWHMYGTLIGLVGLGANVDADGGHTYRYHKTIADAIALDELSASAPMPAVP